MEVLNRIANHEFAGELRVIVEALIPLRGNREETENYLRETLMSGAYKDFHKEDLRDALLDAIRGNDKRTFGYAYYFLGAWKNRTSGCVVVEDAFCYANEASINYSLWREEQKPATKANSPRTIPQELNTDRARAIFAKAVEAGYMEKTATGYKWLYNSGSKASLAYFIMQVFSPDNTKQIPFKALGQLFDVTRLDRALDQATTAKKLQQWRGAIDNLLKDL